MEKYTQMLGRVVTISTYAIIFCIIGNMVMPALIVESVNAQSVTSSTTTQPKLSASDQKIIDKAQVDAKAAMYKDWGLTKSEITFSDSFDMDVINQKVDKYVTYDKNGVASINANAFRKDGTVKLSKNNTEIAISIANKKIAKYNQNLKSTISTIDKNVKSASGVTTLSSNSNSKITTKTILARGYEAKVEIPANSNSLSVMAASNGCSQYVQWANYRSEWWGYKSYSIRLTDCAVTLVQDSGVVGTAIATAIAYSVPPLAPIAGSIAVALGLVTAWNWWMRDWCGGDGLVYKYKGWNLFSLTPWYLSNAMYITCD